VSLQFASSRPEEVTFHPIRDLTSARFLNNPARKSPQFSRHTRGSTKSAFLSADLRTCSSLYLDMHSNVRVLNPRSIQRAATEGIADARNVLLKHDKRAGPCLAAESTDPGVTSPATRRFFSSENNSFGR